jgi:protein-tyrosine phosphatase
MNPDLFWIPGPWPGRLAVVARPRGADWLDEEALGWRRAGLDLVVSLLEPQEAEELELLRESEAAEANGVLFVAFPIPDRGVPASLPAALSLLRRISDALGQGNNVAVHCRQGIGRSGLVAAGVLVASGMPAKTAIETVSQARGQTIPETYHQLHWLRSLPAEQLLMVSS